MKIENNNAIFIISNFLDPLSAEKTRLQKEAFKEAKASMSKEISKIKIELQEMQKRDDKIKARERVVAIKAENIDKVVQKAIDKTRRGTYKKATEVIEKEYLSKELQHKKIVSDLKKQLGDIKRKLEQSSQQAQGEVFELELKKLLKNTFPADVIQPIAKGKLGADIVQKINDPNGHHCGTIIWELKNTKGWQKAWLPKLRVDQRREKAEIAVLVSSVLPKRMNTRFGHIAGVWVADFSVAMGLAAALRMNLIEISHLRSAEKGKTAKMEIIYQYLMSTEFKQRIEAIVEAFISMKDELNKEKERTHKNWAKREKNLELVLQNITGMIGSIQSLVPTFPKIKRLELPYPR